jgi:hypothetical protein
MLRDDKILSFLNISAELSKTLLKENGEFSPFAYVFNNKNELEPIRIEKIGIGSSFEKRVDECCEYLLAFNDFVCVFDVKAGEGNIVVILLGIDGDRSELGYIPYEINTSGDVSMGELSYDW